MRLFLSYRHADSSHVAGRLREHLLSKLGIQSVFLDVASIPPATDFRKAIRSAMQDCDAVLALVGPAWIRKTGRQANEPSAANEDYVYLEVEEAIHLGLPLFPVLLDDTQMPRAAALPEAIRQLTYLKAARLRHDPDFSDDIVRLVTSITSQGSLDPFVNPFPGLVLGVTTRKWLESDAKSQLDRALRANLLPIKHLDGSEMPMQLSFFNATSEGGIITRFQLLGTDGLAEWQRHAKLDGSVSELTGRLRNLGYEVWENEPWTLPLWLRVWNVIRHWDWRNYASITIKGSRITEQDVEISVRAGLNASDPAGDYGLFELEVEIYRSSSPLS